MEKRRIACFIPFQREFSGFGGAERRIPHIFSNLDSDVYDTSIVVVCYEHKNEIETEMARYVDEAAKVVYLRSNTSALLHFARSRYDIVCFTDCIIRTIPAIWGAILARSKRVMLMESVNNSSFNFKRKWYKYFFWLNVKLSTHLDCLYPACIPLLTRRFPQKDITVTPSVLPRLETFLKRQNKQNIILFAGRLIKQKNPELFLASVARIRDELRAGGFKCLVCGEGPLRTELSLYVQENGLDDFIEVKGYVNMEEITPVSKVFCSLQSKDNYPSQSLLEAIASGCYCIASNRGDTKRVIKNDFGTLVECDEISISSAILALLTKSEGDWLSIEVNAKRFAKENFSVDKATRHYEWLFGKLW